MTDSAVDHPAHYKSGRSEAIEVIEQFGLGFNLGNVVKYVLRAGRKGDRWEDLKKAAWYLQRELAQLQQGQPDPDFEKAVKQHMGVPTAVVPKPSGKPVRNAVCGECIHLRTFASSCSPGQSRMSNGLGWVKHSCADFEQKMEAKCPSA